MPVLPIFSSLTSEVNGIDIELIGQFVHRRFGRVKPGAGLACRTVSRYAPGIQFYAEVRFHCNGTTSLPQLVIIVEHDLW
jgi:hypothetical protein